MRYLMFAALGPDRPAGRFGSRLAVGGDGCCDFPFLHLAARPGVVYRGLPDDRYFGLAPGSAPPVSSLRPRLQLENPRASMTNSKVFALAAALALLAPALPTLAQTAAPAGNAVVARVNDTPITERDLSLAEIEVGSDLGNLPPETRRRVLVEYIIETQLMADAAGKSELAKGPAFDERMAYYRRKALREAYFDSKVRDTISEAAAKTFYEDQVKGLKPEEEVKARHILVKTKDEAAALKAKIAGGAAFDVVAKESSQDPGTKDNGGLLGFFSKGQMVPQFEEAAFAVKPGDVSEPVESQFGWHIIKVEERRTKPLPTFDEVKERILNAMVHRKAQAVAQSLRDGAKIDILDADIKKQVEDEQKQTSDQQKMIEEQIKKLQESQKAGAEGEKKAQ